MKEKPEKCEEIEMTTQQFNELRQKINELTASQLKSLQGDISQSLNKRKARFFLTKNAICFQNCLHNQTVRIKNLHEIATLPMLTKA